MHESITPARRRKPESLLAFIRANGGIRPDQLEAGDLRAMDAHKERPGRFINKILRPKAGQGLMIDEVYKRAVEAGYMPEEADLNDLLNAIDMEFRGRPCYRLADVDSLPVDEGPGPEPEAPKRGPGRPPKPEGALVNGPSFRVRPEDLNRLGELAPKLGMPFRAVARRCFEVGLRELSGEGF